MAKECWSRLITPENDCVGDKWMIDANSIYQRTVIVSTFTNALTFCTSHETSNLQDLHYMPLTVKHI